MMEIKRHIPNAITSMNLLCGVLATVSAVSGMVEWAAYLIFAGAVFDFFDGFVARMLKVSSPIGKELDSLADIVSFAIAPAAIYSTFVKYILTGDWYYHIYYLSGYGMFWVLLPFVLAVFGALRLAKFNLDTRQTENFLGLTTTATGLFTGSLMLFVVSHLSMFGWVRPWMVVMMVLIFCVLLVSEVPMFSLKIKHWTLAGNELRLALVVIGLTSIVLFGFGGIALTIMLYIIFSLVKYALS